MRVLPRCASARHALPDAARGQAHADRRPLKLAAAVAVKDETGVWAPPSKRRVPHRRGEHRHHDGGQTANTPRARQRCATGGGPLTSQDRKIALTTAAVGATMSTARRFVDTPGLINLEP